MGHNSVLALLLFHLLLSRKNNISWERIKISILLLVACLYDRLERWSREEKKNIREKREYEMGEKMWNLCDLLEHFMSNTKWHCWILCLRKIGEQGEKENCEICNLNFNGLLSSRNTGREKNLVILKNKFAGFLPHKTLLGKKIAFMK